MAGMVADKKNDDNPSSDSENDISNNGSKHLFVL